MPGALHAQPVSGNEYITVRIPDASITANHTDFIVYLDLALIEAETGNFFSGLESDGSDLRVYEDDHSTELNWDTTNVNIGSEQGFLLIKISLTDGGNNDFIVDWEGDRTAKGAAFHEATWSNFKMIWFLNKYTGASAIDNKNGTSALDLTPNNFSAVSSGSPFYKYLSFDGVNDYCAIANNDGHDLSFPFTIQAWIFVPSGGFGKDNANILSKYTTANSGKQYIFDVWDDDRTSAPDNQLRFWSANGSGGAIALYSSTGAITDNDDNNWHRFTWAAVAAPSTNDKSFFVDGSGYGNTTAASYNYTGGTAPLGVGRITATTTIYYTQDVAHISWENTARSSAWVTDTDLMHSNPATFFTFIY